MDQIAADGDARIAAVAREGASSDAIDALTTRPGAQVLVLDPLERAATDELVAAVLGGPCEPDLLDAVWDRCGGHPLYVEVALAEARQRGAVRRHGGSWALEEPITSRRLDQLVAGRLEQVDPGARAAAEVVAVAGPLPAGLLRVVVPPPAIDQVVHDGVLVRRRVEGSALVAMAHPLFAEACAQQVSAQREREICRSVIDAAQKTEADLDVARLGRLLLRSGDMDVALAVRAGNEALRRGDLALAEELARGAEAASPASVPALVTLVRALAYGGRGEDAARSPRSGPTVCWP